MKTILIFYFLAIPVIFTNLREKPDAAIPAVEESNHHIDNADEQAVRQIIEQWKDGYNNGNAAKVAALYSEDAYYLTQHYITGIVHPRSAIQAYVQRGIDAKYHIDSIEVLYMDLSGSFGYVITRYDSTNGGEKGFGVNVVVLKKIDGNWLIVAHEAAVPDPEQAIRDLGSMK